MSLDDPVTDVCIITNILIVRQENQNYLDVIRVIRLSTIKKQNLPKLANIKRRHYALDMDNEKLYTLQEVAKFLRVSERSMYRYIKSGKLKAVKVGHWKITEKNFHDFLKQNEYRA